MEPRLALLPVHRRRQRSSSSAPWALPGRAPVAAVATSRAVDAHEPPPASWPPFAQLVHAAQPLATLDSCRPHVQDSAALAISPPHGLSLAPAEGGAVDPCSAWRADPDDGQRAALAEPSPSAGSSPAPCPTPFDAFQQQHLPFCTSSPDEECGLAPPPWGSQDLDLGSASSPAQSANAHPLDLPTLPPPTALPPSYAHQDEPWTYSYPYYTSGQTYRQPPYAPSDALPQHAHAYGDQGLPHKVAYDDFPHPALMPEPYAAAITPASYEFEEGMRPLCVVTNVSAASTPAAAAAAMAGDSGASCSPFSTPVFGFSPLYPSSTFSARTETLFPSTAPTPTFSFASVLLNQFFHNPYLAPEVARSQDATLPDVRRRLAAGGGGAAGAEQAGAKSRKGKGRAGRRASAGVLPAYDDDDKDGGDGLETKSGATAAWRSAGRKCAGTPPHPTGLALNDPCVVPAGMAEADASGPQATPLELPSAAVPAGPSCMPSSRRARPSRSSSLPTPAPLSTSSTARYPRASALAPAPRKPRSAWHLFLADVFARARVELAASEGEGEGEGGGGRLDIARLTREAGVVYWALPPAEKEHYAAMAAAAKAEYDGALAAWHAALTPEAVRRENLFREGQRRAGVSRGAYLGGRPGRAEGPARAAQTVVRFFLFLQAVRADPGRRADVFGAVRETAVQAREAGRRWHAMGEGERAPFERRAAEARATYRQALAQYESAKGGAHDDK